MEELAQLAGDKEVGASLLRLLILRRDLGNMEGN